MFAHNFLIINPYNNFILFIDCCFDKFLLEEEKNIYTHTEGIYCAVSVIRFYVSTHNVMGYFKLGFMSAQQG